MNTITGKTKAYITEYSSLRPEDFKSPDGAMVNQFQFYNGTLTPSGWTFVGEATITVELVDPNALIGNKVEALKAQLQKHRADSHVVEKRLKDQIGKLLAISFEPSEA